jgi:signal transduction histidine kinase
MFGVARRLGASDMSVSRFLIGAVALGFALLVAAVLASAWVVGRSREHGDTIKHTYEVEVAIARAQLLLEQSEATRRGYLLSRDPRFEETFRDFRRQLGPAVARVAGLVQDNPRQVSNLTEFRRRTTALIAKQDRSVALARAGQGSAAVQGFTAEAAYAPLRLIRSVSARMLAEERRLLAIRSERQRRSVRLFYTIVTIAGAMLVLLAGGTTLTLLRVTRDLQASRDEARRLNETLEEQVAERTADLSRANEEIQRFAYIVSHDLRSPLVNVMGFTSELEEAAQPLAALVDRAETEAPALLTDEARSAAREDLPEAIGFIRTSTAKMDRLINAILKLSREGRRVVAPEPLDLAAIADGVVASMRQVIDARGAKVEVRRPLPEVVSDRVGVEQILSNLIENAVKYLQPGRPGRVSVVGGREGGRVRLSVIDNGRGIAPGDHQRVFDLFRRSGAQDQPGEGIGLAHVRALAYRLGGAIDVESRLGEGSTFTLTLPATLQDARA